MKKKLILASSSPRRKKILQNLGLEFKVIPSDFNEELDNLLFNYDKIEQLAYNKAATVYDKIKKDSGDFLVISADTVVVLDEKILTKPSDFQDALKMLKSLSGKKHSVVTSVCIIETLTGKFKISSCTSNVEFNEVNEKMLVDYIEKFSPYDKAGSYGIQELPEGFVKSVEGSFDNIVGLCPIQLNELLKCFC